MNEEYAWNQYKKIYGDFLIDTNHFPLGPNEIYINHKDFIDRAFRPEEINTFLDFFLAKLYWITLGLIVFFTLKIVFSSKFSQALKEMNWGYLRFIKYVFLIWGVLLVPWYSWGILLVNYDPHYPVWNFFPWSVSNYSFLGQTIEDWIFYPSCLLFASMVFVLSEKAKRTISDFKNRTKILDLYYIGFILLSVFFYHVDFTSKSLLFFFGLPSVILYPFIRRRVHSKIFLYWMVGLTLFGCFWDFICINLFSVILGDYFNLPFRFAQSWNYVGIDERGEILQSNGLACYFTKSWAWWGSVPISISPWIGITGSQSFYNLSVVFRIWILK